METTTLSLREQYEKAKSENPKARIREIARQLSASEAELVALKVGDTNTRLEGNFPELLKEVQSLGYVMALTRNDNVVHERKGVYNNVSFNGPVGLVLDPDIDLRLFMMHWAFGFAVNENDRKSLQFFDKSGEAVHKIYLTDKSDEAAYQALVEKYRAAEQPTALTTEAYPAPKAELPDSDINVEEFRKGWLNLKDTHEFFGLVNTHKLTRTQALRLAPEGHAFKVPNDITRRMFDAASAKQIAIMIFVGSRGCIQIHTGEINRIVTTGPWLNILDPELNIHLREDQIASTYVVRKPSVDGIVTSIEVFDAQGELIVQFFGKRKPGVPELESWRSLVDELRQS